MSTNSFFSVPREELLKFYPAIKSNSQSQYNVGLKLAAEGNNGPAISHLLISTEEMIKALIVVLDAKGFNFRNIKGMNVFFKNHEIRFFVGYLIFIMTLFGEDLVKAMSKMREDPKSINLHALYFDKPRLNLKLKWYFLRKFIVINKEMHWFSKAEVFRQNGFYVDMKGDLVSPLKLTDKEFNEAKERLEKINKSTQSLIDTYLCEDPLLQSEIEKVKKIFEADNLYKKIEEELENKRKGKQTFFEIFNNSFLSDIRGSITADNSKFKGIIDKHNKNNKEL